MDRCYTQRSTLYWFVYISEHCTWSVTSYHTLSVIDINLWSRYTVWWRLIYCEYTCFIVYKQYKPESDVDIIQRDTFKFVQCNTSKEDEPNYESWKQLISCILHTWIWRPTRLKTKFIWKYTKISIPRWRYT